MSQPLATVAELLSELRSVSALHDAKSRFAVDRLEQLVNGTIENADAMKDHAESMKVVIESIREARDVTAPWPPREPVEPTVERAEVIRWLDELVARVKEPKAAALTSPPLSLDGLVIYINVMNPSRLQPSPEPN